MPQYISVKSNNTVYLQCLFTLPGEVTSEDLVGPVQQGRGAGRSGIPYHVT